MRIILILLYYVYRILDLAILAYCILSWIAAPGSRLFEFYRKLAYYIEPLFIPARKILYKLRLNIPIDLSPWLTMILLGIVYRILAVLLGG